MDLPTAQLICDEMRKSSSDFLVDGVAEAAVRYARIRTDWVLASSEERQDRDAARTAAHNRLIDACNILSRNMAEKGEDIQWRDRLGYDRKAIGDFACYLHCILGLGAR